LLAAKGVKATVIARDKFILKPQVEAERGPGRGAAKLLSKRAARSSSSDRR